MPPDVGTIDPPPWVIPPGWTGDNIARCRSCKAVIMWCWTPRGKKAPIDRDGVNHFATCPNADTWRHRNRR